MVEHVVTTLDDLATSAEEAPVAVDSTSRSGTSTIGEEDGLDDWHEQVAVDFLLGFPLGRVDYVEDRITYSRR